MCEVPIGPLFHLQFYKKYIKLFILGVSAAISALWLCYIVVFCVAWFNNQNTMVFLLQFLQKKRPLCELYKYTHTNKHTYIHMHTPMFQAN